MTRSAPPRSGRIWIFGIIIWTLLGTLNAAQNAAWRAFMGRPAPFLAILPTSLADWLTCGMFTPAYFWMVRRYPIRGERWWSHLPVHLAASFGSVLLKVAAYTPIFNFLNPDFHRTYTMVLFGGFYAD